MQLEQLKIRIKRIQRRAWHHLLILPTSTLNVNLGKSGLVHDQPPRFLRVRRTTKDVTRAEPKKVDIAVMAREQSGVDTHLRPRPGAKIIIADGSVEILQVIITVLEDKIINETMIDIVQAARGKNEHHHIKKYKKKSKNQLSGSRLRDKQSIPVAFTCLLSK